MALAQAHVQSIAELFTVMDKDGSGFIDKLEWLGGYHEYAQLADGGTSAAGHRPSDDQCKVMLSWHEGELLTTGMEKVLPLDLKRLGLQTTDKSKTTSGVTTIGAILDQSKAEVAALKSVIAQFESDHGE